MAILMAILTIEKQSMVNSILWDCIHVYMYTEGFGGV